MTKIKLTVTAYDQDEYCVKMTVQGVNHHWDRLTRAQLEKLRDQLLTSWSTLENFINEWIPS